VIGGDDRGCSSIFVFVSTDFRCGATVQRFNSVLLHDGFNDDDRPEWGALPNKVL